MYDLSNDDEPMHSCTRILTLFEGYRSTEWRWITGGGKSCDSCAANHGRWGRGRGRGREGVEGARAWQLQCGRRRRPRAAESKGSWSSSASAAVGRRRTSSRCKPTHPTPTHPPTQHPARGMVKHSPPSCCAQYRYSSRRTGVANMLSSDASNPTYPPHQPNRTETHPPGESQQVDR